MILSSPLLWLLCSTSGTLVANMLSRNAHSHNASVMLVYNVPGCILSKSNPLSAFLTPATTPSHFVRRTDVIVLISLQDCSSLG